MSQLPLTMRLVTWLYKLHFSHWKTDACQGLGFLLLQENKYLKYLCPTSHFLLSFKSLMELKSISELWCEGSFKKCSF